MAIEATLINGVQPSITTADDVYTSPAAGAGTRITAFTASKVGAGTETYRVFIGATAETAKEIIPARSLAGPGADSPLELINQRVPPGEKIFVQVSTLSTISFRATGIEF